jgi:hypothetical protein
MDNAAEEENEKAKYAAFTINTQRRQEEQEAGEILQSRRREVRVFGQKRISNLAMVRLRPCLWSRRETPTSPWCLHSCAP